MESRQKYMREPLLCNLPYCFFSPLFFSVFLLLVKFLFVFIAHLNVSHRLFGLECLLITVPCFG